MVFVRKGFTPAFFLSLTFVLSALNTQAQQPAELPTPTGSFGIGRTAFQWVDKSRPEVMPDNKTDHRELLVYLFYPTDPKAKGEAAVYFPHLKEIEAFEERYGKDYFKNGYGSSYNRLGNLRTHTIENANITKGRFPLLIFSHGGGMPVLYYTAIIEELVSHGYVVAAVEHSGDGATVVFPDGRIIAQAGWDEINQRPKDEKTAFKRSRYKRAAEDQSFVLDQLEKLDQGSLPGGPKQFKGRFDTGKAGALGHSFGGIVSIFACARDKRFKFCLNLDGGVDGDYGSPTQPVGAMVAGGQSTPRPGESEEAFSKRKEANKRHQDGWKVPFNGAVKGGLFIFVGTPGFTHYSFFDLPVDQSESGPWSATPEQFRLNKQIIRASTLAAFDRVFKPKKVDPFDSLLKPYPAVSIDYLSPTSNKSPDEQTKIEKVKFSTYTLTNGLRVVLAPDQTRSGVAINLSFNAGTAKETAGRSGSADLIQRLVLQDLRKTLRNEATSFDSVVNQERASYFSEFPATQLNSVLSSLADQMHEPDVDQASIDAYLIAIQNQCRQSSERRFGRVQETLVELIYGDVAYKYGAVCSLSDQDRLSPDKVRPFFKTFYVPNNAVLAVVGNFSTDHVKSAVARHFAAIPRKPIPSGIEIDKGSQISFERRKILSASRIDAGTYMSAYLTVPSNHPDWYALNILADIIGQGDTSRLYRALVAKNLASSVPEGVAESRGQSLLRIGAALLPGSSIESVEAIIDLEIKRIQNNGVTRSEIDKARSQERSYYAEQLGTLPGKASFLARSTLYYGDPNRINTELRRILAVTPKDVQRVASRYLVKTNRAVVFTKP